jgi:hypothetical protein
MRGRARAEVGGWAVVWQARAQRQPRAAPLIPGRQALARCQGPATQTLWQLTACRTPARARADPLTDKLTLHVPDALPPELRLDGVQGPREGAPRVEPQRHAEACHRVGDGLRLPGVLFEVAGAAGGFSCWGAWARAAAQMPSEWLGRHRGGETAGQREKCARNGRAGATQSGRKARPASGCCARPPVAWQFQHRRPTPFSRRGLQLLLRRGPGAWCAAGRGGALP